MNNLEDGNLAVSEIDFNAQAGPRIIPSPSSPCDLTCVGSGGGATAVHEEEHLQEFLRLLDERNELELRLGYVARRMRILERMAALGI